METQQGDVLFHRLLNESDETSIPDSAKKVAPDEKTSRPRHLLAEGEATGHAHAVYDLDTCEMYEDDKGTLYMRVKGDTDTPCVVEHEEHKPVVLEPGDYRIGIVQEYDPFADAVRRVQD